jgi:hypothetical protein
MGGSGENANTPEFTLKRGQGSLIGIDLRRHIGWQITAHHHFW